MHTSYSPPNRQTPAKTSHKWTYKPTLTWQRKKGSSSGPISSPSCALLSSSPSWLPIHGKLPKISPPLIAIITPIRLHRTGSSVWYEIRRRFYQGCCGGQWKHDQLSDWLLNGNQLHLAWLELRLFLQPQRKSKFRALRLLLSWIDPRRLLEPSKSARIYRSQLEQLLSIVYPTFTCFFLQWVAL